jgi:hypothetical protein
MTTGIEVTDLMQKNVDFLKAMGVTTISYSITENKWNNLSVGITTAGVQRG